MAIKVTKAEKKPIYNKKICSLLDEYRQVVIDVADTIELDPLLELIKKGEKVGSSEAALLTKLRIKFFSYRPICLSIYDNESIFSLEVLNFTKDDLVNKFTAGVSMVASLSLAFSYPTLAAAPWVFINTYKNLFTPSYKLKEYLNDQSKFVIAIAPVALAENVIIPVAEKEEKVDPTNGSNDDDLGFRLFD